jgi:hypothetical protein
MNLGLLLVNLIFLVVWFSPMCAYVYKMTLNFLKFFVECVPRHMRVMKPT